MGWNKGALKVLAFMFVLQNANAMDIKENLIIEENTQVSPKIDIDITMGEGKKVKSVTIQSQNLFMRNITSEEDLDFYHQIFSNQTSMSQYMEGKPRPEEEIKNIRFPKYYGWWEKGNPYSSYLTFLNKSAARKFLNEQEKKGEEETEIFFMLKENLKFKGKIFVAHPVDNRNPYNSYFTFLSGKDADEFLEKKHQNLEIKSKILSDLKKEFFMTEKIFIGHVLLEPGEDRELIKTDAELSYVLLPTFWRRGYGTEAIGNIVELAKSHLSKKIPLGENEILALVATARPDNPGSCEILKRLDFSRFKQDIKFEALRNFYVKDL